MMLTVGFEELTGKTLTKCRLVDEDMIEFKCTDGTEYQLFHYQDCCETVTVEDICGDLDDLIGVPILLAEEATSETPPDGAQAYECDLWTFYKLRTIKGSVDIRWHGTSDGWYSMSVSFERVK